MSEQGEYPLADDAGEPGTSGTENAPSRSRLASGAPGDADAARRSDGAPGSAPGAAPASAASAASSGALAGAERVIWTGRSSQWTNLPVFVLCGLLAFLVVPLLVAAWVILQTRMASYTLTTERLRTERGVLSKTRDELELYRVRDMEATQSFWQRIVGIGTIRLVTSDRSHPEMVLPGIRAHRSAMDLIRGQTEEMRKVKRVRELDVE